MDNKTSTVRTAAVEVLGALYYQLGTRFTSMAITDTMKPALKSMIEAEFQRVGYDPTAATKASRVVKGEGGTTTSATGVIPRVDLNTALDKNILSELTSTEGKNSWQVCITTIIIFFYFITLLLYYFILLFYLLILCNQLIYFIIINLYRIVKLQLKL